MRTDDLFEWLAACCFVAAGYFFVGMTLALLVGGACFAYFAQCYHEPLPRPKLPKVRLPRLRRRKA